MTGIIWGHHLSNIRSPFATRPPAELSWRVQDGKLTPRFGDKSALLQAC